MAVLIAMLRGVNIGSYQKVNMGELKTLCAGLGLRGVLTYIQSGNIVFHEDTGDVDAVGKKLDRAIEDRFGFRPGIVLRTAAELRKTVANNPFAGRTDVLPNRLLVVFLGGTPTRQAQQQILAVECPEELRLAGRALYIHYPNGMAHPKLSIVRIEKMLGCVSTGRNLNTVNKLLSMAELLQASQA